MVKMASELKCTVVVVGDAMVGKSALIRRLIQDVYVENYSPTSFDKFRVVKEVDKHRVEFIIWDTSGSPTFDPVRSLSYEEADVFLLCFKISDPASLYSIKDKWIKDLRRHRPDYPAVILCGCQTDLRADPSTQSQLGKVGRTPTTPEQALGICCEIGALNYVETSSLGSTSKQVMEAFEVCALALIRHAASVAKKRQQNRAVPQQPPPSRVTNRKSMLVVPCNGSSKSTQDGADGSGNVSCSTDSSLNKKYSPLNVSFSTSESDSLQHVSTSSSPSGSRENRRSVVAEDDDVFYQLDHRPKRISRRSRGWSQHRASSSSSSNLPTQSTSSVPTRMEEWLPNASGPQQPCRAKRTEFEDIILLQIPNPAVKPGVNDDDDLDRTRFRIGGKTSFKSDDSDMPHVAQKGDFEAVVLDLTRQQIRVAEHCRDNDPENQRRVKKVYESIKSQGSTASQGSTGSSKISMASGSDSLGATSTRAANSEMGKQKHPAKSTQRDIPDPDAPDTEDPELLNRLQFVSPKLGVFRPVNHATSYQLQTGKNGGKSKCCLM